MGRWFLGLMLVLSAVPAVRADDLTDALVPADPRSRLRSGTGAAYGRVFSPHQEESAAPAEETTEAEQIPTLPSGPYEDLRSPLLQKPSAQEPEDETSTHLPRSRLSLPQSEQSDATLGRPDQRDGVWYGDEPAR